MAKREIIGDGKIKKATGSLGRGKNGREEGGGEEGKVTLDLVWDSP